MKRHTRMLPVFRTTMVVLTLGTAAPAVWADASSDEITCDRPQGSTIKLGRAKLFFEHNSTDEDTGVHGAFDTSSFAELCVYNPKGQQILAVKPQGNLLKLTMGEIFFESREPPNAEVSIESLKADFPERKYTVRGFSHDGRGLTGAATFTHDIPAAPIITFPEDNAVVDSTDLTVMWERVTQSLDGAPINTTGYEIIITKDVADDPHGSLDLRSTCTFYPRRRLCQFPASFLSQVRPTNLSSWH